MESAVASSAFSQQIKVGSTVLMVGAIVLWIGQLFVPLPPFLQPIFSVTQVVLLIHAIEGAIAAILIFRYRQFSQNQFPQNSVLKRPASHGDAQPENRLTQHLPKSTPLAVLKAGLYAFFVGTIGLVEIIKAIK
ncbi:MAG: hypothetical protein HC800_14815 [Phormidesmis sp. RL_2_1]|nr:hypothetical protein [Phormidesmis sp. RL_2_1]